LGAEAQHAIGPAVPRSGSPTQATEVAARRCFGVVRQLQLR